MKRWVMIAALLLVGCLDENKPATKPLLPLTQVPANVRRQAMARLPGVRFHTAWRLPNGGYQLRGNDPKGVSHDVEVNSDGAVLFSN